MLAYKLKRCNQAGSHHVQFACMLTRQPIQDVLAFARHTELDAPLVGRIFNPLQKTLAFTAINQLDGAVVLESKPRRSICDCDRGIARSAGHLKQQLMLLRLQTRPQCCLLTETEK